MEENKRINLTGKHLLQYGEIVLTREWKNPSGAIVTERYIIWDTCKMNGDTEAKNPENKKKMFVLTQMYGEIVTMKQV